MVSNNTIKCKWQKNELIPQMDWNRNNCLQGSVNDKSHFKGEHIQKSHDQTHHDSL